MSSPRIIHDAKPTAKYLRELKNRNEGKFGWWKSAIRIDWAKARQGNNSTTWATLYLTTESGQTSPLIVRIFGERVSGTIMPRTDAAVAQMQAALPKFVIKKREGPATLGFQKFSVKVELQDDGISPRVDASGNPIFPSDEFRSAFFEVVELVNEAFTQDVKSRLEFGNELIKFALAAKQENATTTAASVVEKFNAAHPRSPSDIIFNTDNLNALKRAYPLPADQKLFMAHGAITADNVKVVSAVQEFVSSKSAKNAGTLLANPIARVKIVLGKPKQSTAIHDKTKPYMANEFQRYEFKTVGSDAITEDNVHMAIQSGDSIDGVVDASTTCISNMGISLPISAMLIVVQPRSKNGSITEDDLYGFGYEDAGNHRVEGVTTPVNAADQLTESDLANMVQNVGL